MYSFNLKKAAPACSTAAGYPAEDHGVRVDKRGRPIVSASVDQVGAPTSSQSAGKLIAGWFDSTRPQGQTVCPWTTVRSTDGVYNTRNGKPSHPTTTCSSGAGAATPTPNFILSIFTTAQINSWSDCAWSDPLYDKLFLEQQTTIDPTPSGPPSSTRWSRIIYQQSPYIPTAYPESVEAYNYKDWQGWQSTPGRERRRCSSHSPVMASYLTVHPVSVAAGNKVELESGAHRPWSSPSSLPWSSWSLPSR